MSFGAGLSEDEIRQLESKIEFALPMTYRRFLLERNGANTDTVIEFGNNEQTTIDVLFGVGVARPLDLVCWWDEFYGDLPDQSLLIGKGAGGGFLLMKVSSEFEELFFYDHALQFECSSDEGNTHIIKGRLADVFRNLMG